MRAEKIYSRYNHLEPYSLNQKPNTLPSPPTFARLMLFRYNNIIYTED